MRRLWRAGLPLTVAAGTLLSLAVGVAPAQASCSPVGVSSDDGSSITCVTYPTAGDTRLADLTIHSTANNANEIVRVLFPTNYASQPSRTWPSLYLLHGGSVGGNSSHVDWTANTDIEARTASANALVIMPDAGNVGFYSDWINDPQKWETFHMVELRQLLDRNYRTNTNRAIAGLSMGGFGALSYAARHPGDFKAVASYSGAAHPYADAQAIQAVVATGLKGINDFWGDPTTASGRTIWQQHDPYYLVNNLLSIPIYVSSGDGTAGPNDPSPSIPIPETTTNSESQAFASQLTAAYVAAHPGATTDPLLTTHFYSPGTHTWPYWQREMATSLPMLLSAIGA
jgi:diacylglycerol O-acyltransferase / trehalose O-mycolyltransferase